MNGQWDERCYPTFLVDDYRLDVIRTCGPLCDSLQQVRSAVDLAVPDAGRTHIGANLR